MHEDIGATQRWVMLVCSMIAAMTTTCVVSGVPYLIPTLHPTRASPSPRRR